MKKLLFSIFTLIIISVYADSYTNNQNKDEKILSINLINPCQNPSGEWWDCPNPIVYVLYKNKIPGAILLPTTPSALFNPPTVPTETGDSILMAIATGYYHQPCLSESPVMQPIIVDLISPDRTILDTESVGVLMANCPIPQN